LSFYSVVVIVIDRTGYISRCGHEISV